MLFTSEHGAPNARPFATPQTALMITDIFARRYATVPLRTQYFQEDFRFMVQAAVMVGNLPIAS